MIGTYFYSPDLQRQLRQRARRAALRRAAWWVLAFLASGLAWAVIFWAVGEVVR